jgi:hypothetical protein
MGNGDFHSRHTDFKRTTFLGVSRPGDWPEVLMGFVLRILVQEEAQLIKGCLPYASSAKEA